MCISILALWLCVSFPLYRDCLKLSFFCHHLTSFNKFFIVQASTATTFKQYNRKYSIVLSFKNQNHITPEQLLEVRSSIKTRTRKEWNKTTTTQMSTHTHTHNIYGPTQIMAVRSQWQTKFQRFPIMWEMQTTTKAEINKAVISRVVPNSFECVVFVCVKGTKWNFMLIVFYGHNSKAILTAY